jgi:uncharacterized delta-60 repeat protein
MTLRPRFLVVLVTLAACYRHDPLYCDDPTDCADVAGRPFCDIAGEHPASDGIARTCIPDPAATDGADAGTGLAVTAAAPAHLQVGATIAIEVTVARAPGGTGPIDVAVASLPLGLTAAPLAIPSSMSTGTLTVSAATDAPFGPVTLSLEAHDGTRSGRADVTLAIVGVPGTRDTSFGTGGIAIVSVSDGAAMVRSIAHGDGFIAALADLSLVRVTAAGAVDESFGTGGRVRLDTSALGLVSIAEVRLSRDPDDGIIVVAHGPATTAGLYHELIARVSRDGSVVLAPRLLHAEPSEDRACGVTAVQNGKVVVGSARANGARLRRYQGNGALDPTFEAFPPTRWGCESLFAAPGGGVYIRSDNSEIRRYDVTGDDDQTFGVDGAVTLAGMPLWKTLEVQPDGALRIGGTVGSLGVWQLNSAGTADPGFGVDGYHAFPAVPNHSHQVFAVRETAEGLVAIGKIIGNWSQGDGAVMVRLRRDGRPDESFGAGGVMIEDDRWNITAAFLLDGRHALFLRPQAAGAVELRRFWY